MARVVGVSLMVSSEVEGMGESAMPTGSFSSSSSSDTGSSAGRDRTEAAVAMRGEVTSGGCVELFMKSESFGMPCEVQSAREEEMMAIQMSWMDWTLNHGRNAKLRASA